MKKDGKEVADKFIKKTRTNFSERLKKIEELTLYMIDQDKKLEAQQGEIQALKKQLEDRK